MNCLGMVSREAGQSLVPAPPHMITGMMAVIPVPSASISALFLTELGESFKDWIKAAAPELESGRNSGRD